MVRRRGPAPAAQARASNSRLTRSSWRTWPQRKLRRKVPSVDGAFTVQPREHRPFLRRATHRRRRCSRRPASAEATRVIILSPAFARPGALPRSRCCSTSSTQAEIPGQGGRKEQPGIVATRRWSSKVIWIRSRWLRGSKIGLPSQIQRSTLLLLQEASHTRPFGGLGLKGS